MARHPPLTADTAMVDAKMSGYVKLMHRANFLLARVGEVLADVIRAAVLIGVLVAALSNEVEGAIRLGLVFIILLAPRCAGVTWAVDLAVCVLLPLATVASVANWYRQLSWLDWVLHGVTTGAVAVMTYLVLLRTPLLPRGLQHGRAATTFLTVSIGLTLGVLWEFYEWFAQFFGVPIGVSYGDTIADLAMDGLGSMLAGIALSAWIANGHNRYRGESVAHPR